MVSVSTKFDEYYRKKHPNRNLKWLFHHGQVELQPTFTKKKYFFTTNVVQTVVLCMFNDKDSLTFTQIKDQGNIIESVLGEALKFLCNPKMKILMKENMKTPKFEKDEKCTINLEFSN
jgi:hypothetical protein